MSDPLPLEVTLSAKGLGNIPMDSQPNEFEFTAGKRSYRCPIFVAEFLSPKIASLRLLDQTVTSYRVGVEDPDGSFANFLALGRGATIDMTTENYYFYLAVCSELCNEELCSIIESHYLIDLTINNVCHVLETKVLHGFDRRREIGFIAAHFSEISESQLLQLTLDQLIDVLSHDGLRIKDEDWLYDFIARNFRADSRFAVLFENVAFEFLSAESIMDFIKSDIFTYMSFPIWNSVCHRLMLKVEPKVKNTNRYWIKSTEIPLNPDYPLRGIIFTLSQRCGGNVSDHNLVNVSASSNSSGYKVQDVADLESDVKFATRDVPNSWICYDFKDFRIRPTGYSIRSQYDTGSGNCHLRSWVIESSDDGILWTEIDKRQNNNDLNGQNLTKCFHIERSQKCRCIRLRQTGKSHSNNDLIFISSFEIFGVLYEHTV
jgi:hypothetical protein